MTGRILPVVRSRRAEANRTSGRTAGPLAPSAARPAPLPALGERAERLVDSFGRVHRDLRISLTDRCSLRCSYCMPAEGVPCLPARLFLTADEIVRVARTAVGLGVTHVRLTGGEPLLRHDIVDIVRRIAALPGAPEVSMTTNGIGLDRLATPLAEAGLARVNVSLDTLRPERFRTMTRRDRHADVLAGLAAARAAGLAPIKLNAVLLRGVNDDEACDLLRYAIEGGHQLRFIEQMPLGADGAWTRDGIVTADEILAALGSEFALSPMAARGSAPAALWQVDGGPGAVGVIAAVTRPFCGDCDRIRLTADGQLRSCLFSTDETDLRPVLRTAGPAATVPAVALLTSAETAGTPRGVVRGGAAAARMDGPGDVAGDERVAAAIRECVAAKPAGHAIGTDGFTQPDRPMSAIGG